MDYEYGLFSEEFKKDSLRFVRFDFNNFKMIMCNQSSNFVDFKNIIYKHG